MSTLRTAPILAVALLLALACVPAWAAAATAPTLTSPASGAANFAEGGSMTFVWSGTLQGDPDTLNRAFYRLEIAKAADVPAGVQTEWPTVENFVPTEPGENATTASVGVPTAGAYRWRVCAWGVVDDVAANEIQQLPGGCSATRSFETKAVAASRGAIGELKMEEKTEVAGEVRRVFVTRPGSSTPQPVAPQPATPVTAAPEEPVVERVEELAEAIFQPLRGASTGGGGNSALGLGGSGLSADSAATRDGIVGSVFNGLGSTLPLIPIPFWTLALLLACFPLARAWRRSVLGMFDWPDGSIDGRGGMDDVLSDLAYVPLAQGLKNDSKTVDGTAPAPAMTPSAPDWGRHAA